MTALSNNPPQPRASPWPPLWWIAGIGVAIGAQLALDGGDVALGITGYLAAAILVVSGVASGPARLPPASAPDSAALSAAVLARPWQTALSLLAVAAGAATFMLSEGNRYRPLGVACWLISIAYWGLAWWRVREHRTQSTEHRTQSTEHRTQSTEHRAPELIQGGNGAFRSSRLLTAALLVAILALGAFFRFSELADNPLDMNSDQAEKLLDIKDVIDGTPHIFFERNTGREPWQFYWTVALIKLFNLKQDFMALKIGTALIGWLMLPAIFLLAREVFGVRTALVATLFAAVASWGVITARFGLRYPLAPCAVAWTMAFLVRGLRRQDRNAMLLAGVWLGIGLQGYSAYRLMLAVVPLIIGAWAARQWWRRQPRAAARTVLDGAIAAVMAILVVMPLLRYGLDNPDQLLSRAATRLTDQEQAISGRPADIFADNVKNVLLMFNYTRDEVWVANLPDRPAMDGALGALLIIGAACAVALSIQSRNPWPSLLLLSGILMLIPSALSIAYPRENPSVVRTGGALPMLMIMCAIVPGQLLDWAAGGRSSLALRLSSRAGVVALCVAVIVVNARRVFADYPQQYCPRAQNASDIAREMDMWVAQGHERFNAYLVGYPHWVDSRAVGVWIGDIDFSNTLGVRVGRPDVVQVDLRGQPGWFALNADDAESWVALLTRYPQGHTRLVTGSQCSQKHFVVFTTD